MTSVDSPLEKISQQSLLSFTGRKSIRKLFGKKLDSLTPPNLIDVQRDSYKAFLWAGEGKETDDSLDFGIRDVFKSIFPIHDVQGRSTLEFVKYNLEQPKSDVEECLQRGLTFAASLRVTLRLIVWDIDEESKVKSIRDIKEQDVYMGDMPLMTDSGTFVINGTERVIVSQMQRSPGVFFDVERGKSTSDKQIHTARVIPYRGSWLDFEFDNRGTLGMRIDRKRRLPATTILFAFEGAMMQSLREQYPDGVPPALNTGMSKAEILAIVYEQEHVSRLSAQRTWSAPIVKKRLEGVTPHSDLVDALSGDVLFKANKKITPRAIAQKSAVLENSRLRLTREALFGRFLAQDVINVDTGLVYAEAGDPLTPELLDTIDQRGIDTLPFLVLEETFNAQHLLQTLHSDRTQTRDEALIEIYRIIRPGEPATREAAELLFHGLFFDFERFDLSAVGRVKMNARLGFRDADVPVSCRTLRVEDVIAIVRTICLLHEGKEETDDIDHLGNRRVRSVGELLENQYRLGLSRMERSVIERMGGIEIDRATPQDLINAKPVVAAVREFFGSSQLSQFMDQTNPLSEITHKRRLSALGPGGLTRERAGFEVRDVHATHYGRICPIETPEGPNIGLINSLATFARVNRYGFIEAPYRIVRDGIATDDVVYLSAMAEADQTIAQATALTLEGKFADDMVPCRKNGEYLLAPPQEINLVDVSPKQIVSAAASLIPFLENDDANRALMGSNMQRQAVPLLRSEAPLVGTGMEGRVASNSGSVIIAKRDGFVDQVDARRIVVSATHPRDDGDSGVDIYTLKKFQRSNQNSCINQRPLVNAGDTVQAGDILADGSSTHNGELALGRNVMVAFMPWSGYNFEDSILVSERIVRDDVFTSIDIEEYEITCRDTKLGPEEITRDIPSISEEALRNLDETGIIYIGAHVKAGDILVGKITPKGESPITPEEKLLRAIFGEKASAVRDSSLYVPPGGSGIVVDVRILSRAGIEKDERSIQMERLSLDRYIKDREDERKILTRTFKRRLQSVLTGNNVTHGIANRIDVGTILTQEILEQLNRNELCTLRVTDPIVNQSVARLQEDFERAIAQIIDRYNARVERLQRGDDLLPGVMQIIKVFVASKRKLQPGDKMAGRHGNKGVISRIIPMEDMPFTEDGTPVDIVLNPLGVPSRMNVGQIMETHLGWASYQLGTQMRELFDALSRQADASVVTQKLKTKIASLYDSKLISEALDQFTPSDIAQLGRNLQNGMPVATPVFDGAKEDDINRLLQQAGLPTSGQAWLIDGRSGERFDRPVTIGILYMLKLHHLVDDKIHARSVGPYSLVTQQPLGGKAQFGGQRLGEMEVWALQAYGAAHTLQEMLTVKSDDITGRTKVYESIIRGQDGYEIGTPESFNVLMRELSALALNIDLINTNKDS